MEANQNPQPGGEVVTVGAFSEDRSKREVFGFLVVDCKAYLAPQHRLTVYFLRDLVSGAKKCKSAQLF